MSQTPIVRPISWPRAGISLLVLVAFIAFGWWLDPRYGILAGTLAYLLCSIGLRTLISRDHRAAIAHVKKKEFEKAIARFQTSLDFFNRHPKIDRLRAITMLSAAAMSYREMALVSLGFCYGQIGDGRKSRNYYETCLREFPNSGMAESALRLMDAARASMDGT